MNDVGKYLYDSISADVEKNNKLRILIEEFHKISLNHDNEKIRQALEIINELSDLLNSSK
jgi:flagellin-specific chaperone FliS